MSHNYDFVRIQTEEGQELGRTGNWTRDEGSRKQMDIDISLLTMGDSEEDLR